MNPAILAGETCSERKFYGFNHLDDRVREAFWKIEQSLKD